jgi:hypothetical protein
MKKNLSAPSIGTILKGLITLRTKVQKRHISYITYEVVEKVLLQKQLRNDCENYKNIGAYKMYSCTGQ